MGLSFDDSMALPARTPVILTMGSLPPVRCLKLHKPSEENGCGVSFAIARPLETLWSLDSRMFPEHPNASADDSFIVELDTSAQPVEYAYDQVLAR